MAIYYAVVREGFVQKDTMRGLLEIYEDEISANKSKPQCCDVVRVEVLRLPPLNKNSLEPDQPGE